MTALSRRKRRLTFETDTLVQNRPVVVEPEPLIVTLRRKGTRARLSISWYTIYTHAAQIAADRIRAERKAAREAKRKNRSLR